MAGGGDSYAEINKVLIDLSVTNFIDANRNDLMGNRELQPMINLYFENIAKTSDLVRKNKYRNEFAAQYESVYKEHVLLLAKIREVQVKLEKKHKKAKGWKIFGYVSVGVLIVPVAVLGFLALSSPSVANTYTKRVDFGAGNLVERVKKFPEFMEVEEKSVEKQQHLCLHIKNHTVRIIAGMEAIKES